MLIIGHRALRGVGDRSSTKPDAVRCFILGLLQPPCSRIVANVAKNIFQLLPETQEPRPRADGPWPA